MFFEQLPSHSLGKGIKSRKVWIDTCELSNTLCLFLHLIPFYSPAWRDTGLARSPATKSPAMLTAPIFGPSFRDLNQTDSICFFLWLTRECYGQFGGSFWFRGGFFPCFFLSWLRTTPPLTLSHWTPTWTRNATPRDIKGTSAFTAAYSHKYGLKTYFFISNHKNISRSLSHQTHEDFGLCAGRTHHSSTCDNIWFILFMLCIALRLWAQF